MRALVQRLNELCNAVPFDASWYLKDLTTGQSADRRGRVPVPSASTRKISIMMAALADGTPGFAVAAQLTVRMARLCYDGLG